MKKATLIYNKSNTYGIQSDVQLLEKVMKGFSVKHADPLEPPQACDLAVHVEIPFYGWMPWSARNVFLVNPEWWEAGWNSYLAHCNALIFKCSADKETFYTRFPEASAVPFYTLPWTSPVVQADFSKFPASTATDVGFLWLLGASKNKREAAKKVIPLWDATWPPLTVYTTTELGLEGELPTSVRIHVKDLDVAMRRQLQAFYPGHVIFSAAEAFCMAAHEGQAAGAFLLGNALPTYAEAFQGNSAVHLVPATLEPLNAGMCDSFAGLTASSLAAGIQAFLAADLTEVRRSQKARAITSAGFSAVIVAEVFQKIMSSASASAHLSPLLAQGKPKLGIAETCPPISIVTLLHNRRRFVDLCLHNLLITDYPKDKIEWVVVEDSDIVEEQAADKVLKFGRGCAPMSVSYIPLEKKNVPIGSMRNKAIKMAQHDIILFMDDDDHYPPTSFSKRVAWLVAHPWQPKAVACTTIACYDLIRGTSAVNTPPWTLPLRQRISEATLTFYKSWWEAKKFPKVSMAEGEGFLEGRESDVLELPPQQIIVAMSHGKNTSGRRIPPSGQQPSCFWGFPKEFLVFLHKLAGVDVAETT